jgi:hypothetical protein
MSQKDAGCVYVEGETKHNPNTGLTRPDDALHISLHVCVCMCVVDFVYAAHACSLSVSVSACVRVTL